MVQDPTLICVRVEVVSVAEGDRSVGPQHPDDHHHSSEDKDEADGSLPLTSAETIDDGWGRPSWRGRG